MKIPTFEQFIWLQNVPKLKIQAFSIKKRNVSASAVVLYLFEDQMKRAGTKNHLSKRQYIALKKLSDQNLSKLLV